MPFSSLWGKITGKDKGLQYPQQQASVLGRVGDFVVVYPYGLYCDVPNGTLLQAVGPNAIAPVTVVRPEDLETGEPVFFHPGTNTRIIARNNGDLDILSGGGGGDVNIQTVSANITASTSVTVDTPITTFTGDVQIDGALNVAGEITGGASIAVAANCIAGAILQGATLAVAGAGSIGGKDFTTHTHAQGVDSRGDTQANTGSVV